MGKALIAMNKTDRLVYALLAGSLAGKQKNQQPSRKHRRMAWGVPRGRKRPQIACLAAGSPLKPCRQAGNTELPNCQFIPEVTDFRKKTLHSVALSWIEIAYKLHQITWNMQNRTEGKAIPCFGPMKGRG
jgi:hypothetical protein